MTSVLVMLIVVHQNDSSFSFEKALQNFKESTGIEMTDSLQHFVHNQMKEIYTADR